MCQHSHTNTSHRRTLTSHLPLTTPHLTLSESQHHLVDHHKIHHQVSALWLLPPTTIRYGQLYSIIQLCILTTYFMDLCQWWSKLTFFGARAELFGSDYFFLEPEPELFGSDYFFWSQSRAFWLWYFFWSQSRAFWLWLFFFGARAGLLALNFYFGACHGAWSFGSLLELW